MAHTLTSMQGDQIAHADTTSQTLRFPSLHVNNKNRVSEDFHTGRSFVKGLVSVTLYGWKDKRHRRRKKKLCMGKIFRIHMLWPFSRDQFYSRSVRVLPRRVLLKNSHKGHWECSESTSCISILAVNKAATWFGYFVIEKPEWNKWQFYMSTCFKRMWMQFWWMLNTQLYTFSVRCSSLSSGYAMSSSSFCGIPLESPFSCQ